MSQVQPASEAQPLPVEEDGPERAAWQQDFDQAAQRLRESYPEDFAFSRVDGPSAGTIGFAEQVPDSASVAFDGLPPGVTVVGGAGYSERQLEESSLALLEIADEKTSDDVELATYVDWTDKTVHLVYGGQGIASTAMATMQRVESSLRDQARVPSEFGLSIDYSDETVTEQEDYTAGYSLYRDDAYHCSSAFPVKRTDGAEIGLLTAGHCGSRSKYTASSLDIFSVISGSQATTSDFPGGDFRWFWSSAMFSGQTYIGVATPRVFDASATASIDSRICKFGNTTKYGCSTVTRSAIYYNVTVSSEDGGGTYYSGPFRGVAGHITDGGDSGGLWFFGTTGYGIHSGVVNGGSVFSSLPNALSRFGLNLWQG